MFKNTLRSLSRGVRLLEKNGPREFSSRAAYFLIRRKIVPAVNQFVEPHVLSETNVREICHARDSFFGYYGSADSVSVTNPQTPHKLGEETVEALRSKYPETIPIPEPYVCELQDASLLGPEAIAKISAGYPKGDLSITGISNGVILALSRGVLPTGGFALGGAERYGRVVPLVGEYARTYFHWFQDYLPRLKGVEYYVERTGNRPKLLVPAEPPRWMRDSLLAMGYDESTWSTWSGDCGRVDRLIFPTVQIESPEAFDRARFPAPSTYQWLSRRIKKGISPTSTRDHSPRVYISRDDATERQVENEAAVMELLDEFGFERYRLSDLSFAEQVTLFRDADSIVGPHGGGFINMIYADDPTIIELFGPKKRYGTPGHMYQIAQCLGYEYGCVEGATVGRNLRVDTEKLETLLDRML